MLQVAEATVLLVPLTAKESVRVHASRPYPINFQLSTAVGGRGRSMWADLAPRRRKHGSNGFP